MTSRVTSCQNFFNFPYVMWLAQSFDSCPIILIEIDFVANILTLKIVIKPDWGLVCFICDCCSIYEHRFTQVCLFDAEGTSNFSCEQRIKVWRGAFLIQISSSSYEDLDIKESASLCLVSLWVSLRRFENIQRGL